MGGFCQKAIVILDVRLTLIIGEGSGGEQM